MTGNSTCISGNNTSVCLDAGSAAAGLPAWPAVFLLLLLIPAGVVAYKYRSQIRSSFRSARRQSQKKEEGHKAPAAKSHPFIHVRGQHSTKQVPIYENLTAQKAKSNVNRGSQRASPERGEDLYLQCDFSDDAIYSNDAACNLSILTDSPEEDLYILPDA